MDGYVVQQPRLILGRERQFGEEIPGEELAGLKPVVIAAMLSEGILRRQGVPGEHAEKLEMIVAQLERLAERVDELVKNQAAVLEQLDTYGEDAGKLHHEISRRVKTLEDARSPTRGRTRGS